MYLFVNSLTKNKKIIALLKNGQIIRKITIPTKDNHSEKILEKLDELFKKSGKKMKNIKGIIVVNGPGSFVGIRIILSIVNTLAWFFKIPTCGLPLNEEDNNQQLIGKAIECLEKQKNNYFIKPYYGKEPNITKPKL